MQFLYFVEFPWILPISMKIYENLRLKKADVVFYNIL